jgi:predicted secreted hydrolase
MTEKPKAIEFPQDELAHDHIIEWWYFNGRLKDKDGGEYAFMNCLFRADVKKVKIPFLEKIPFKIIYFYHSIISDITHKKSYPTVELATIVSNDSFSKPLLFINHTNPIVITGYTNRVIEETKKFTYHIKDKDMDIVLTSVKNPLLEGGTGFLDLKTKTTYYYSLTNLKTEGKIKIKDEWIEVSGKSWMDHQWANTAYSKEKWTWFSIQLEHNVEMVCFEYENAGTINRLASISHANGTQEDFTDIIFTPLGETWKSPKTEALYPLAWNIRIPEKNIDINAKALIQEQEMIFGSINYWEGPVAVTGTWNGKTVKGDGFMELEGYPSNYTNTKFIKDELESRIGEALAYTKKMLGQNPKKE